MPKRSEDDYLILFQMVKLPKHEAKKVGLGIIFGLVGSIISLLIFGSEYKILSYTVIGIFIFFGYFLIGKLIA